MLSLLTFVGAAVAEIAGCYSFWAWLRLGRPVWILGLGGVSLALFAYLLALVDTDAAGRAFAAYGGIYVAAAIAWMWMVEGVRPDRWDLLGVVLMLAGSVVILWAPRGS